MDVTRLIRRAGRIPTGIDRVEIAYLHRLIAEPLPLYCLARTRLGYVLLDQTGAQALGQRVTGNTAWGPPDMISRLTVRRPGSRERGESDLRLLGINRCPPAGLSRMLNRRLPAGTAYLNVGHSNLTARVLSATKRLGPVSVLIHDTIPVDYPEYQRPGTSEVFRDLLHRVQGSADLVIYNSAHTRNRAETYLSQWGDPPRHVVSHLGVELTEPGDLPIGFDPNSPYFLSLGTIEPRKGHDLLLDVWQDLEKKHGSRTPRLLICGARGWNNRKVFDRLDRLPPDGPVVEMGALPDTQIAALMARASALLFPSKAEGFGLPPVEAAALGLPVIASDLPVLREVLGDIPVYLCETDRYQWQNMIEYYSGIGSGENRKTTGPKFVPPSWDNHFNDVLSFT